MAITAQPRPSTPSITEQRTAHAYQPARTLGLVGYGSGKLHDYDRHRGKHALKFLSSLVFTHIPGNRLMHYDPNTGVCTEFRTGTNSTNGLMYTLSDNIRALTDGTVEHLENHDVTRPWWGLILLS